MRKTITALYADVETGGFDPQIHALTSICVGKFTLFHDRKPEIETIYLPIRACQSLIITENAAQVQGKSVTQLYAEGLTEEAQLSVLRQWLSDYDCAGLAIWAHNAGFDRGFLSAACRRNNLPKGHLVGTFAGRDSRWNCTQYLAEYLVQKRRLEMPQKPDGTASVSLDPLMERLGIPGRQGSGHDAHEDVMLGVAVLDKLLRLDGWWE